MKPPVAYIGSVIGIVNDYILDSVEHHFLGIAHGQSRSGYQQG